MAQFEDLDVWKRAARLSTELYKYFQSSKDYGFRDQITRSGLSIPSNIAEGYERDTAKDRTKFLTYAKGSCGELRTQIYIGMIMGLRFVITMNRAHHRCKEEKLYLCRNK